MRCHTNVSKSLSRVSLVQCTRRQAKCLLQLLQYLSSVPPTGQLWHKAFFRWVRHRAGAHTRSAWPKIPSTPSAFPLLGAPQTPQSPKGCKSLGDGPWGRRKSPAAETHSARSVLQPAQPAKVRPKNWRSAVLLQLLFGICPPSHQPDEFDTKPFFRWVRGQGWSLHAQVLGEDIKHGLLPRQYKYRSY